MIDILAQIATELAPIGGVSIIIIYLANRNFKKMVEHSDLSNSNSRKLHNDPDDPPVKTSNCTLKSGTISENLAKQGNDIKIIHTRIDNLIGSQAANTKSIIDEIKKNNN